MVIKIKTHDGTQWHPFLPNSTNFTTLAQTIETAVFLTKKGSVVGIFVYDILVCTAIDGIIMWNAKYELIFAPKATVVNLQPISL